MNPDILNALIAKKDLSRDEAKAFLNAVIAGELTPAQIGAVLVALRMKGEHADEITGLLESMREHMLTIDAPGAIDIVGTGGDGSGTFNISTASALVAAGAGAKVAKHGNRAASSRCGSADVLEHLGVNIMLTPEQAKKVFDAAGIVFLLAPVYHAALKNVVAVRKELKIRTIFNILGPFANPAGTKRQLIGVPDQRVAKMMAKVVAALPHEHVVIVTSSDGLDEISISAPTHALDIQDGRVRSSTIEPEKLGLKKAPLAEILGGNADDNAGIIRAVLEGADGPARNVVVLNAAYGLYAAGLATTPREGVALAQTSIDSGAAKKALERLAAESKKYV